MLEEEDGDGLRDERSVEGDAMGAWEEVGEDEAEDGGEDWPLLCMFMPVFWGMSRRPRLGLIWAVAVAPRARRVVARMCLRYMVYLI